LTGDLALMSLAVLLIEAFRPSERGSGFLTAHQHILGHSVPENGLKM